MSSRSELWKSIIAKVSNARGIKLPPFMFTQNLNPDQIKVYLRSLQIFILENVLQEHRRKYATLFEPLKGDRALDHKIFLKTNWPINQIRAMSTGDKLLILQEDISTEHLPKSTKDYIEDIAIPEISITFDDFLPEEWDSQENKIFLDQLSFEYL